MILWFVPTILNNRTMILWFCAHYSKQKDHDFVCLCPLFQTMGLWFCRCCILYQTTSESMYFCYFIRNSVIWIESLFIQCQTIQWSTCSTEKGIWFFKLPWQISYTVILKSRREKHLTEHLLPGRNKSVWGGGGLSCLLIVVVSTYFSVFHLNLKICITDVLLETNLSKHCCGPVSSFSCLACSLLQQIWNRTL